MKSFFTLTKRLKFWKVKREHLSLPDNATIVIVGGGPAGAFFAIQAARKARALGKAIDLLIIEKKKGALLLQVNLFP